MKTTSTFPLRLPRSINEAVVKVREKDGTSINQFIATAVAEMLAVMDAERFFKTRCATKNRMRELRSCGTVRDEGSNALVYSE
jgi:hypothetical protein